MGTLTSSESHNATAAQRAAFENRYGDGSFEQLLRLLAQPCISFAHIATRFGVTRERVRQWQREWLTDAPTGLQRRRLCAAYQEKRRLMLDPLFRAFHRHAREAVGADRIQPLRSRRGYQTRTVRIDRYTVALRDAVTRPPQYRGRADFVYFRLASDAFLFVPSRADFAAHPQNTFAALGLPKAVRLKPDTTSSSPKEQSL